VVGEARGRGDWEGVVEGAEGRMERLGLEEGTMERCYCDHVMNILRG